MPQQFKLTLDSPITVARATNLRMAEMRLDFIRGTSRAVIVLSDDAGGELRRIPIDGKLSALDTFLTRVKGSDTTFEQELLEYLKVVDRALFGIDITGPVEEVNPSPGGP